MKRFTLIGLLVIVSLIGGWHGVLFYINHDPALPRPIPMVSQAELSISRAPDFIPQSLKPSGEPQHPFLAPTGSSLMHGGSWESDSHASAVFYGDKVQVRSRRAGGKLPRQCATFTFVAEHYPLILCGGLTSFRLQLLDPDSLKMLAHYDLPMRPSTFAALVKRNPDLIFSDTSGGAYFYLDAQGGAVLADSRQYIRRIQPVQRQGKWRFVQTHSWDMRAYVPRDCFHYNNLWPKGECDGITAVMPDYNGDIWWVTRNGRVGTLSPETGQVHMTGLEGEEIQNSFALDQQGAYIVSDHALYHFRLEAGRPNRQWRLAYDRGSGRKSGSINQGSGTSPTLLGNNYVTFTDNADGQIGLIVAYRHAVPEGRSRQICRVPIFTPGHSATDNSMIAHGRAIIVENNSGYTHSQSQTDYTLVQGGVVRVDVRSDESGCDLIWSSPLKVPSVVAKLSLGSGVAYFYSFEILPDGERLWALVGLDFMSGREVIRIPTGTGVGFNNNWASIAMAPNGDSYIGTRHGLVQIRGRTE